MNKRIVLYVIISIICVISIIIGVYYQIFVEREDTSQNNVLQDQNNNVDNNEDLELELLLEEFNLLFDNKFNNLNNDTSIVKKIQGLEEQDIIYSVYNIKEEKNEKYNVNINLPVVNIDGDIAKEFNNITQTIFANKANEVLSNSQVYTIYNVDYTAYLNENILSVILKSTLKEGNNPQRVIVQTYNYDIVTGQKVTLNDILEINGIDYIDVNKKIEKQVEEANKRAEAVSKALAQTGQVVYKRDINNAMYTTDNANYFFVGEDGKIYIIYPYGNSNFTSEMDIIKI